jgi:hypothetical protein
MNPEILAIASEEMLPTRQATEHALEPTPEITPLTVESFKLVGGGSSIILLG